MRKAGLAAMALMSAGCAPVPPTEPVEARIPVHGAAGARCDASRAGNLVGREADAALGAEALRSSGAGTLRWIPPGAMVTMDYREDRLNIDLDARNRVTRIRCG